MIWYSINAYLISSSTINSQIKHGKNRRNKQSIWTCLLFSPANTMGNCKTAHAENELLVLCKFHKLSVVHRSCWFFQVSQFDVQRITESVILDHEVDQRTCKLVYRINSKMVSGANMSWLMWICFFRLLFVHWCRSIRCLNMFVGDMCKVAPVELMLKLGVIIDLSFV